MKRYMNLFSLIILNMVVGSCVDDVVLPFEVKKPESLAQYEYLNTYDVLKSYIDRSKYPNFKLGTGITANDFNKKGVDYELATTNYDEMTAGNAMKYASCVSDDGSMNFTTVQKFVETARDAGITIYGHTLAWHAQQNNKYLNGLIADKEIVVNPDEKLEVEDYVVDYSKDAFTFWKGVPEGTTISVNSSEGCLEIKNPTPTAQNYEVQYHTTIDGLPIVKDKEYKLKMMVKGSGAGRLAVSVGPWGGRAEGGFAFDTEWKEYVFTFKAVADGGHVMTQSGLFAGTIQIKYVKITHSETPVVEILTDIITNGDAEGSETTNFVSTHVGGTNGSCDIVEGVGKDGSRAFVVTSAGGGEFSHSTQFFLYADRPLVAEDVVRISFDYRADTSNKSESQSHANPGGYIHYDAGCAVDFTTEWKHFEKTITINTTLSPAGNMQTFAWNLDVGSPNAPANKYYFDNIKLQIVTKGNTNPLTPEEKKEVLTGAMNTWIAGMMKATGGYVTAWDVVNEAISGGGNDGQGFYTLQSASNVSADDAKNNFYWQDYLGNEDYTRIVVAAARKYYAENGGVNPLKLFVNDYNLESDWDDNKKVKSLVHWIEKWEADGVTKIDGIGSQMHVSCYANAATQKSKEEHVVKMFEILANSGKLVKITELDMGYIDENGQSVKTDKMTEAQHKAMSEYYKFIVKKYFKIIPVAQQYGITQWCITDSPTDSGWRGGEPVGLWDAQYSRKHTYAGFADGLAGK